MPAARRRIVFAPPKPKYTVTVFTDVECGYCRKLHSEIAEYNRQGIAVEYLAFPRMGLGSDDYQKMVSVWCAPDRRKALTDAKDDQPRAKTDLQTRVTMQYDVGQRVGLTGTPMILAARRHPARRLHAAGRAARGARQAGGRKAARRRPPAPAGS